MAGNIFGINLRDAEPYSGNPLAEKKEKMPDDLPVHGLQTLTMLLRHLEPYLAICWGTQAANDAVGYWLATLDALKLRHCPWDHAYYLFRLMLKDYKDRWEDFTAITDIPLPWNIEGPTLRKLQHCQGLEGQQESLKKIRDGWMLKPKDTARPNGQSVQPQRHQHREGQVQGCTGDTRTEDTAEKVLRRQ